MYQVKRDLQLLATKWWVVNQAIQQFLVYLHRNAFYFVALAGLFIEQWLVKGLRVS